MNNGLTKILVSRDFDLLNNVWHIQLLKSKKASLILRRIQQLLSLYIRHITKGITRINITGLGSKEGIIIFFFSFKNNAEYIQKSNYWFIQIKFYLDKRSFLIKLPPTPSKEKKKPTVEIANIELATPFFLNCLKEYKKNKPIPALNSISLPKHLSYICSLVNYQVGNT